MVLSPESSMIKIDTMCAGYPKHDVLCGLSIQVFAGEICVIIGPSGSGKSTLLKTLTGLLKPNKGSISILNRDISRKHNRKYIRKKIGYIPQNLGLVRSYSVKKNILLGSLANTSTLASLFGLFDTRAVETADELVEKLGLKHIADVPVTQLSGGEKRRVAIGRALFRSPEILIADEFLSELDVATCEQIMKLVIELKEVYQTTIILIEHNLERALKYADTIIILKEGKVRGSYKREEVTLQLLKEFLSSEEQSTKNKRETN